MTSRILNGKEYPRLTEILSSTDPPHVRRQLANWKRKNPSTYYADLGTVVHEWVSKAVVCRGEIQDILLKPLEECSTVTELWDRGYVFECQHPTKNFVLSIWEFPDKLQHSWFVKCKLLCPIIRAVDKVFWAEEDLVGGNKTFLTYEDSDCCFSTRPDLICTFKNNPERIWLVELKTSKGLYSDQPCPESWVIGGTQVTDDGEVVQIQPWKARSQQIGHEKYLKTSTQLYAQSLAISQSLGFEVSDHMIWVATNKNFQLLKVKHNAAADWNARVQQYFKAA